MSNWTVKSTYRLQTGDLQATVIYSEGTYSARVEGPIRAICKQFSNLNDATDWCESKAATSRSKTETRLEYLERQVEWIVGRMK